MIRSFKFALYPSRAQRVLLEQALDACRGVYNAGLSERKQAWEVEKRSVAYRQQQDALPSWKEARADWRGVHAQVLQDALRRLDKAFKAFYRRLQKGEKPGCPRFKGQDRYDSLTYPQWGNGARLSGRKLVLSKIGAVNLRLHRPLPPEAKVKTVTIRREGKRWHACLTAELPSTRTEPRPLQRAVGVDVGVKNLVALSTGELVPAPRFLAKAEERLARAQRELARKGKGSAKRFKQLLRVREIHRHVREQRRDFLHKLSHRLVNEFDIIAFERLDVQEMATKGYLAKGILDASWQQLQAFTAYKAEEAGARVALVEPRGTTQECSQCGLNVPKGLKDRTHQCPACGLVLDRDVNAARNILKRVGWEPPELTPVETPEKELMKREALALRLE